MSNKTESHRIKMLNHLKKASEILKEVIDKLKRLKV